MVFVMFLDAAQAAKTLPKESQKTSAKSLLKSLHKNNPPPWARDWAPPPRGCFCIAFIDYPQLFHVFLVYSAPTGRMPPCENYAPHVYSVIYSRCLLMEG